MEPQETYSELRKMLQQQGHTAEDIDKIVERVRRYEQETQFDSIMESIGSGRLNLDSLIKEALED